MCHLYRLRIKTHVLTFTMPCINCFIARQFPHKMVLNAVHRQKEVDFIRAINEVCEGNPSPRTHQLLLQLKKPLVEDMKPLYIFGTNYNVDFFNYMMLEKVNGQEQIFTSDDSGTKLSYKRCGANKYVLLKTGCKVIVTRNLYNGLVNGISATVTKLEENCVTIKLDTDIHLNHAMQGKEFLISKYTFITRDNSNTITSVRKQIPLKLGYAVTVDKCQGRTLDAVVVDSSNFWRPGQFGVAIGRATSKSSIELTSYNKEAAMLKYPAIVHDFYAQRNLMMQQNLHCCNRANYDEVNFLTRCQYDCKQCVGREYKRVF